MTFEPVNIKFETIGFDSLYFMNNLGTFTLILFYQLIVFLVWLALKPFSKKSKSINRKQKRLTTYIFWNNWIVIVQESFVIVLLCVAISLKYNLTFDSSGQIIQTIFCIATTIVYVALPMIFTYKAFYNFEKANRIDIKQEIGAIYENRNTG